MKRQIIFLFAIVATVPFLNACNSSQATETKDNISDSEDIVYPVVKVAETIPTQELHIPGELMSFYETELFSKVNSYIKKIHADIGDHVKVGDILAELEAPELNAQLAEAYAKVRASEAQLMASKSVFRRLLKAAQTLGAVSPNDIDVARSKTVADSLSLLGTSAVYQSILEMNSYLKVKAPFDGVITNRKLSPGAFVGPNDKNAMPLFSIKQENKLRLQIPVPERYVEDIHKNQLVTFTVMSSPDKVFNGKVSRIAQNVDRQTRSEIIEIEVPNQKMNLVSGMYAQVILPIERGHKSLIVPSSAVTTTMEKCFVVKIEGGKSKWIDVKKGIETDGKTEIFGDIHKGDIVLKTANDEMKAGTSLKVSETNF
ncbi:efflux RND transporter periplasmic adaptor subunit [Arcicella aquatica]|uniref:Efflux RND transporter periplasmic adaptor subunit n=1 Tax=Arcicella aquatica TaxID=217141 RepID=A0ABU5QRR3_9BACT|nr:efflux RND transporter periplasmic adaptor subunit [Arcicella aquatica]MEA5259529.1 efflux RND transporter periplasmic adaptor subunit [Arcicella aquatica]